MFACQAQAVVDAHGQPSAGVLHRGTVTGTRTPHESPFTSIKCCTEGLVIWWRSGMTRHGTRGMISGVRPE